MAYVFRGGIYFGDNRKTRRSPIERLTPPGHLSVPLYSSDIVGAADSVGAADVVVAVGDSVQRGSLIGNGAVAVHSPVSGTVTAIENVTMPNGSVTAVVRIENDGEYTVAPTVKACEKKLSECESDEIIEVVRSAGICDADGTPADKKLSDAVAKTEYCILNCVFDEPYVNGERRLAAENPTAVINGFKIILKALHQRRGIIAVAENDSEIVRKLNSLLRKDKLISVTTVRAKYPGGGDRELIYSVMGRELPEGRTPADAACVIFGAMTAANIFTAFASGMPCVSRIVTVDGDCVVRPVNLLVPIGTPFSKLIAHAGGLKKEPAVIVEGGPLTGKTTELSAFVTKSTSALLVFSRAEQDSYHQPHACIRCGRCMNVCPMRITPYKLHKLITEGKKGKALREGALLCQECGACSYICPGKVPITQTIREFKADYYKIEDSVKEDDK